MWIAEKEMYFRYIMQWRHIDIHAPIGDVCI